VKRLLAWSCFVVLSLAACSSLGGQAAPAAIPGRSAGASPDGTAAADREAEPLRLVALGDAYTAGTGTLAPRRDSWPAQLSTAMERGDVRLWLVDNLADSGQTSEDVLRSQIPQLEALVPDVVTLQVGVNDIVAPTVSLDDYRTNIATILDELLRSLAPDRIFLITTPDHTLTARGADWGSREAGRADVQAANAILKAAAAARRITVIDIAPVNERVVEDPSLVVRDDYYPTAKQYAGWVEIIGPAMRRVLTATEP
jgi:lysophospholipase L1-like esterase